MMTVLTCVAVDHNIWLVLIAALICISGAWAVVHLLARASVTTGMQRTGWQFLASVASGSAIWCTHFVAMLAYDPGVPISFDPLLTVASVLVAIVGSLISFTLATSGLFRFSAAFGGAATGLTISAMHYTGMLAYRVQGIVAWDMSYLIASVVLAVVFSTAALHLAIRHQGLRAMIAAAALLTFAIVSLHFTGMTAFSVSPMLVGINFSNPQALQAMAVAVAVVGFIVVGAGFASYFIDDQMRAESYQQLRQMALSDPLTGLPNRARFSIHLDEMVSGARETGSKLAIVGIDLDRFKEINDLRGHSAGDEVLGQLAKRMTAMLRSGEFVARLGGDEFAAVKRLTEDTTLEDFLARLETALSEPLQLGDYEATVGASIGIAIFPDDAGEPETLVNNADLAMYRAKADITRSVCFYEASMDETVRARRTLAKELREAIHQGEMELHFQIQKAVASGQAVGFEALARWRHPVRGYVPPSEFIPIAEENGLILQLGEWVLRRACAEAKKWPHPFKVAVNLSSVQFAHANLPKLIHEVLLETGLSPGRLELELTETAVIADKTRSLHTLRLIKALGVTIALDDFGTGYSSLETLRTFPFDKIKLDRSFMNEVETSPQAKAIIRAVLALGKSLDIPVLAEGVETESQLSILSVEGCDEVQGYLLGRPAPVDQIAPFGAAPVQDVPGTRAA